MVTKPPAQPTLVVNGHAVHAIRTLAGITRKTLADELNVDVSYLTRIELGQRRHVGVNIVTALAHALRVDRRAVLDGAIRSVGELTDSDGLTA